jgi:rhodanese-related sulfurtransferase
MLHEITPFVIKHWPLVGAFFVVLMLIFFEEAKSKQAGGDRLTPAGVTQLINREDAVVVDLRDASAYRDGHIVNAKNFPLADFDRMKEKLAVFRDRPIVLVDAMGLKTAPVVIQLKKDGFQKVVSLKGGIDTWKTESMPVTKK